MHSPRIPGLGTRPGITRRSDTGSVSKRILRLTLNPCQGPSVARSCARRPGKLERTSAGPCGGVAAPGDPLRRRVRYTRVACPARPGPGPQGSAGSRVTPSRPGRPRAATPFGGGPGPPRCAGLSSLPSGPATRQWLAGSVGGPSRRPARGRGRYARVQAPGCHPPSVRLDRAARGGEIPRRGGGSGARAQPRVAQPHPGAASGQARRPCGRV
jgi:hypothetical protein